MATSDQKSDETKQKKETSTEESKGQVIDVSRPGSAKPSATSRPVIVGSGKIMQDPMMKSSTSSDGKDQTEGQPPLTSSGKTIQPLSVNDTKDKPTDTSDVDSQADEKNDTSAEVAESSSAAEATDDTPPDVSKDSEDKNTDDTNKVDTEKADDVDAESAIVDAVVDQATKKKNTTKQEAQTTDEHIQSLIDQKKYFVTVGKARKRRLDAVIISLSIIAIIVTVVVVANEYEFIHLW